MGFREALPATEDPEAVRPLVRRLLVGGGAVSVSSSEASSVPVGKIDSLCREAEADLVCFIGCWDFDGGLDDGAREGGFVFIVDVDSDRLKTGH